jgi:FkbM family methyltransferase
MITRLMRPGVRRLRHAGDVRAVRKLLEAPAVERVVSVILRSSTVRGVPRFVLRELVGGRVVGRYRLREGDFEILIRHGTADLATLDEVFYRREYEFPDDIRQKLGIDKQPISVIDLGANIGLFGLWVLRHFRDAAVTAFEPDPWNLEMLRRCVALNDQTGRWTVVGAAASNHAGTAAFTGGAVSLSRIEAEGGNAMVETVDVFPYLDGADFAKIDIEGGEWAILGDERFHTCPVQVIVLEYHPHLCPSDDPKMHAHALLERAGYSTIEREHHDDPPGYGLIWASRDS